MSLIPANLASGSGRSLAAVGLDRVPPSIRRTAEGNVDYNYYLMRSRALRASAYAGAFRAAGRAIGAALARARKGVRDWRARRRAIDELLTLDDRTLRDLGLNRSGVLYVVDHGREDVPPPANDRAGATTKVA